jgi:hypothetical protein
VHLTVGRGGRRFLLGLLVASAGVLPAVAIASIERVAVSSVAQALQSQPVQVVGAPSFSLSPPEVRALRAEISRKDPGRIWIAIVPSLSPSNTSRISNGLSGYLNALGGGTVIVVAGGSVWASTSWEDGPGANARLKAAFSNSSEPLARQLGQVVGSFASGDAAAGHPQIGGPTAKTTTATITEPAPAPPAGAASLPVAKQRAAGGTSAGLIIGLIALALLLLAAALLAGPRVRRARRSSHLREEESADVKAKAQSDLAKLADAISDLDIDSSMPKASPAGKTEYAKAMECYQEAGRCLKNSDDDYQFKKALTALAQGHAHVEAAGQLFNPAPAPPREEVDQLARLSALHKSGALTDTEFQAQKRKLIGS